MSEAEIYKELGKKEVTRQRFGYEQLGDRDIKEWMGLVTDELNSFFECATPSDRIIRIRHYEKNWRSELVAFVYPTRDFEEYMDFTLILNPETGEIDEFNPPAIHSINSVTITHIEHDHGMVEEEYMVKVRRQLQTAPEDEFWNRYFFKRYDGDMWLAKVEHVARHIDQTEDEGKFYSRQMTPYDFNEFLKDTAEINTQLRMLLVE